MDKRYQVFVSSTYVDLQYERQKVIQTLMEMDCISAGMEIFPAVDEEQWQFIKKIIDDCDYYLLIIGGRYGTTDHNGLSYTEKEYDYAVGKGIKVIALLHSNPDQIPSGKTDQNEDLSKRLEAFREKISEGRLVKYWDNAEELPGMVALSLSKTIKIYPAVGWVRANTVASEDLWRRISALSAENSSLMDMVKEFKKSAPADIPNIATLEDLFEIHGSYVSYTAMNHRVTSSWSIKLTWAAIFSLISPYLLEYPNNSSVKLTLTQAVFEETGRRGSDKKLNDQCFQTIKIHLSALGLIKVQYMKDTGGGMGLFWSLTDIGEKTMMQLRAIRKSTNPFANAELKSSQDNF